MKLYPMPCQDLNEGDVIIKRLSLSNLIIRPNPGFEIDNALISARILRPATAFRIPLQSSSSQDHAGTLLKGIQCP